MKLPRRLAEVIKRKEAFLNEVRARLERTTVRLQASLFERIIEEIIPRLDVKDGIITDNAHNYRLISELEKVYSTFNVKVAETILPQISKGIEAIAKINEGYFALTLTELPERFASVIESTKVLTDLRIGLRQGKMIRGGLMDTMLRSTPADLQQSLAKAVTSQNDMKDFIKVIKENVIGQEGKPGALDRQFKRFAYDTYMQYDRAYNKKLADEFGMKYFVYQGNLIEDSRDFCVCHIDKVFSIEEAQEWKTWVPADCTYPESHPMKSKSPNEVPSYLGFIGYDPVVDLGGYNCRHIASYVPTDLAIKMRPELEISTK